MKAVTTTQQAKHGGLKAIKPHNHVRVNGVNLKESHALALDVCRLQGEAVLLPTTSVASTLFSGGGTVEFQVQPRDLIVQDMTLSISVTNTDASTDIQFLPHRLIDRVEFVSDSSVIYSCNGDDIYHQLLFMSDEAYNKSRGAMNLGTTHGVGAVIQETASDTYYIPLPNPFSNSEFFLGNLNSPITIRVLSATNWMYSGNSSVITDLECRAMTILLSGEVHHPDVHANMKSVGKNSEYRIISNKNMYVSAPLVASTPYEFQLSSLTGLCAYLVVSVRPSTLDNASAVDYREIKTISLIDRDGNTVGTALDGEYIRSVLSHCVPSSLPLNQELYVLPFAIDLSSAHEGKNSGYFAFGGQERLSVTLPSGASSATYTISVNAYCYNTLKVDNGVARLSN